MPCPQKEQFRGSETMHSGRFNNECPACKPYFKVLSSVQNYVIVVTKCEKPKFYAAIYRQSSFITLSNTCDTVKFILKQIVELISIYLFIVVLRDEQ